jgi:hypothetical protein
MYLQIHYVDRRSMARLRMLQFLDEAFESPETAALRYEEGYEGGLLAKADSLLCPSIILNEFMRL